MPELPEVETVRRHLQRRVPGRVVRAVWTSGLALRKPLPRGFRAAFPGGRFTGVRRIAKFLYLDWESRDGRRGRSLLAHLGMTGYFLHRDREPRRPPPHTHAVWSFADGSCLLFCDPRRFGLLEWVAREGRPANVGPDPTEFHLTGEWLRERLRGSRAAVKSLLIDQRKLAGLGNIYACEALFRAGISPRRVARALTAAEAERLAAAIRTSIAAAVRMRGTTFSDFRDLDDRPGEYGTELQVYGREGKPCRRCRTAVRRIVQAGRSSFFCPRCQRRGAAAGPAPRRREPAPAAARRVTRPATRPARLS